MGDYYTTGGDLDKSILAGVATLYCSFFASAAVHCRGITGVNCQYGNSRQCTHRIEMSEHRIVVKHNMRHESNDYY
jgi:hypothetical protein